MSRSTQLGNFYQVPVQVAPFTNTTCFGANGNNIELTPCVTYADTNPQTWIFETSLEKPSGSSNKGWLKTNDAKLCWTDNGNTNPTLSACDVNNAAQVFSMDFLGNSRIGDDPETASTFWIYQVKGNSGNCVNFDITTAADNKVSVRPAWTWKTCIDQSATPTLSGDQAVIINPVLISEGLPIKKIEEKKGLAGHWIALIVIGSIAALLVILFFVRRMRKNRVSDNKVRNNQYSTDYESQPKVFSMQPTVKPGEYNDNSWNPRTSAYGTISSVPPQNVKKHEVIYSYDAKLEDECTLQVGNIVEVYNVFPDDWASGKNLTTGAIGVFPIVCLSENPIP